MEMLSVMIKIGLLASIVVLVVFVVWAMFSKALRREYEAGRQEGLSHRR